MNRGLFALGIFMAFVVLSLGLLNIDRQMAAHIATEQALEPVVDQLRNLAEDLRRGAPLQVQLQNRLLDFTDALARLELNGTGRPWQPAIAALYRQYLAGVLPDHSVHVYVQPEPLPEYVVASFARRPFGFTATTATAIRDVMVDRNADATETLPLVAADFAQALCFPLSPTLTDSDLFGRLQVFNGPNGRRGFFCHRVTGGGSWQRPTSVMVVAAINLARVADDHGLRAQVQTWARDDVGVAFLPVGGRHLRWSRFWSKHKVLQQRLWARHRQGGVWPVSVCEDGYIIVALPPIYGVPYRTVVATCIPRIDRTGTDFALFLLSFGVTAAGLIVGGRKAVLGLGPRLPVAVLVAGSFLLAVILPIAALEVVARQAIAEAIKKSRQDAVRSLHQRLVTVDNKIDDEVAHFVTSFRRIIRDADLGEQLLAEELSGEDNNLLASLSERIDRDEILNISSMRNFMMLVGPGGFQRLFTSDMGSKGKGTESIAFFLPVARRIHQEMLDGGLPASLRERHGGPLKPADEKAALEYEMTRDALMEGLGSELFYRLRQYPELMSSLRVNLGKVYMIQHPIACRGQTRYLLSLFWDDPGMSVSNVRRNLGKHPVEHAGQLVFADMYAWGNRRSIPEGLERHLDLFRVADRVKSARIMSREETRTASQTLFYEALPSLRMDEVILVGRQRVEDPAGGLRRWLGRAMVSAFAVAVALAAAAAALFLVPLHRVLLGMRAVKDADFSVRLTEADRTDEFGALALAFNTMVKGLHEREILTKYVSPSVRRVVQDAAFGAAAREGEHREMTIVFSSLFDFHAFQERQAPAEVHRVLEEHVAATGEGVARWGGEMHEVIGEKILVFFDHETLGGAERAAQAAVAVCGHVRARLAAAACPPPVMGLNAGSVIAGILGARNVRVAYTVIGDTVNLAARLATLANTVEGSRTVLSGTVRTALGDATAVERLPFRRVKGKTQEVEVFLLVADAGSGNGDAH